MAFVIFVILLDLEFPWYHGGYRLTLNKNVSKAPVAVTSARYRPLPVSRMDYGPKLSILKTGYYLPIFLANHFFDCAFTCYLLIFSFYDHRTPCFFTSSCSPSVTCEQMFYFRHILSHPRLPPDRLGGFNFPDSIFAAFVHPARYTVTPGAQWDAGTANSMFQLGYLNRQVTCTGILQSIPSFCYPSCFVSLWALSWKVFLQQLRGKKTDLGDPILPKDNCNGRASYRKWGTREQYLHLKDTNRRENHPRFQMHRKCVMALFTDDGQEETIVTTSIYCLPELKPQPWNQYWSLVWSYSLQFWQLRLCIIKGVPSPSTGPQGFGQNHR